MHGLIQCFLDRQFFAERVYQPTSALLKPLGQTDGCSIAVFPRQSHVDEVVQRQDTMTNERKAVSLRPAVYLLGTPNNKRRAALITNLAIYRSQYRPSSDQDKSFSAPGNPSEQLLFCSSTR